MEVRRIEVKKYAACWIRVPLVYLCLGYKSLYTMYTWYEFQMNSYFNQKLTLNFGCTIVMIRQGCIIFTPLTIVNVFLRKIKVKPKVVNHSRDS